MISEWAEFQETHGPFGNCISVRVNQVIKGIKVEVCLGRFHYIYEPLSPESNVCKTIEHTSKYKFKKYCLKGLDCNLGENSEPLLENDLARMAKKS